MKGDYAQILKYLVSIDYGKIKIALRYDLRKQMLNVAGPLIFKGDMEKLITEGFIGSDKKLKYRHITNRIIQYNFKIDEQIFLDNIELLKERISIVPVNGFGRLIR